MAKPEEKEKTMPNYIKFLFGGLAGMASVCFVQPLDLIKTRMQLSSSGVKQSSVETIKEIITNEGLFAFYTGLSAALLRQATYTTARLGIYTLLIDSYTTAEKTPGFFMKATFAMAAGIPAAFIGTPTEVALIRMTSDGRLPLAERRNYKNVFDAIFKIAKEEGVTGLWRGAVPTMGRAMVVNAAQLASYSQAKQFLLSTGLLEDNMKCYFVGSMISGIATSTTSLPIDIVKTKIQNMKYIDGVPEYKGAFDVLTKIIRTEGVLALWKGLLPYYARQGPNTVLTFIFLEQLNKQYNLRVLGKTGKGSL